MSVRINSVTGSITEVRRVGDDDNLLPRCKVTVQARDDNLKAVAKEEP